MPAARTTIRSRADPAAATPLSWCAQSPRGTAIGQAIKNASSREVLLARRLCVASLSCSSVLTLVLALSEPHWIPVFLGFALATHLASLLLPLGAAHVYAVRVLLAVASLNAFLVVPELAVRIAGFRYETGTQFGFPRPSRFLRFKPDAQLFWRLDPSAPGVNSLGFPGAEVSVPKPPGVFRILFLGDSCTQQGYPELVELSLSARREGDTRFESVTLAVAGYSSHQGRVLAETYAARMEPDVAFVYFGWNDHWLAYGSRDSEKIVPETVGKLEDLRARLYRYSRLAQAASWSTSHLWGDRVAPLAETRVSAEEYRANIGRIVSVFRDVRVPVVAITAPTSHYRLGLPDALVKDQFVRDAATGIELHRSYNDIVREIAAESGTPTLDLEARFMSLSDGQLKALFTRDGIHLTGRGHSVVAALVAERIQAIRRELDGG